MNKKTKAQSSESKSAITIIVAALTLVGTALTAYFGYGAATAPVKLSIKATQTAEAMLTLVASTATPSPSAAAIPIPSPNTPTPTPQTSPVKITEISVTTSNVPKAGTDANVYIELWGTTADSDGEIYLENPGPDDFERGQTDVFSVTLPDLGQVRKVCIRHDNTGIDSGWHLQDIQVVSEDGEEWTFYFNQWLAVDEPPYQLRACRNEDEL